MILILLIKFEEGRYEVLIRIFRDELAQIFNTSDILLILMHDPKEITLSFSHINYIINVINLVTIIIILYHMANHFNNLAKILFLLILIANIHHVETKKREKKQKPKTIVEANHFYSETNKNALYNISKIELGKPLILLLKKSSASESKQVKTFKIKITEGSKTIDCNFKKSTDLCIIPKVENNTIQMGIECLQLPCELSWIIHQPQAQSAVGNQIALNLYSLQDINEHLIGQITCNDPSITNFHQDITVYSSQEYKQIQQNQILYILFNNEEKGFVFVDIAERSKACTQISFIEAPNIIKLNGNTTKDFIIKGSSTMYELQNYPDSQFRIQATLSRLDKLQSRASIFINAYGLTDQKQEKILSQQLRDFSGLKTNNDFTYIFTKPSDKYKKFKFEFTVQKNNIFLINFDIITKTPHAVSVGEKIYFTLNSNEKIDILIEKNTQAAEADKNYLTPLLSEELKLSKAECPASEDCQVTVQAIKETSNMIYISNTKILSTYIDDDGKGQYRFQSVQFLTINKQSKHKIRNGEHIYFKKTIKKNSSIQVTINNPNVIMYAACKSKCLIPDEECRERTGNFHHPFVYQANQNCQFQINVAALDNGQFVLTIIEQEQYFLPLQNGVPFSYTMDKNQDRIDFTFKLKKKESLNFNLISPLYSLKLLVLNKAKGTPDEENSLVSNDGLIFIQNEDINGLEFVISVVKIQKQQGQSSFIHFTIVVATQSTSIKLEPTVISYENLKPSNSRNFIFEFDPTEDYFLNFYIYNLKDHEINLKLKISDNGKFQDPYEISINREIDYINLNDYSLDLCQEQGSETCEIFLSITNTMEIQVDFSITLIVKNAVVELKDGIWQAFPQNIMTSSTHFYFYPRHFNQSIFIYYHTVNQNLGIAYNLWRYDQNQINPAQWPFQMAPNQNQQIIKDFKQNNYISIDHQKMKEHCEPNCVLLINVYSKNTNSQSNLNQDTKTSFHIMASNSQIELPENHKLNFNINQKEDKNILIDLKYALNKQTLIFFTSKVIGQCMLKANVISQSNSVCPNIEQEEDLPADYQLAWGEYEISIEDIKKKIQDKKMQDDHNYYLCVTVHSQKICKASMEYTSENLSFKKIALDSYEDIKLQSNDTKFYLIEGYIKNFVKITRTKGFPFVAITRCDNKLLFNQCLQNFRANKNNTGKQIVTKMQTFTQEVCEQCSYMFKFTSIEPATLNFHSQSQYSEMQLKENEILTDFINEGQTTRYMIHALLNQDLIINIHVQQGEIQAELSNLKTINLVKESSQNNKIIHYTIKSVIDETQDGGKSLIDPLAMTTDLMVFHLTIKSLNPSKAASFTILYSSGKRKVYLQDGVILDYLLQAKQPHYFYYFNELSAEHIYFTMSMTNAAALNQLQFTVYTLEDPNNQENKTQASLEKPTISKNNVNPTILLKLPQNNYFIIEVKNPTAKQQKIIMGINHQQVILLPFNHNFPFILHKQEQINILVDVNIPGFVQFQIKKCQRSQPSFGYTFDYKSFLMKQFMYETKLNDDPSFKYTIKAQRVGTLYINFQADPEEDTTLTIKAYHSESKNKSTTLKPGKRGLLTYEISSNDMVEVKIPVVDCGEAICKGIKYFYLISDNEEQLYSQLYCASTFFEASQINKTNKTAFVIHKIEARQINKMISLDYAMQKSSTFLGIKAVAPDGQQVFYKPIQVATLYGKWSRLNIVYQLLMVGLISLCLCFLVVFVRVASRKGYEPLNELNQDR